MLSQTLLSLPMWESEKKKKKKKKKTCWKGYLRVSGAQFKSSNDFSLSSVAGHVRAFPAMRKKEIRQYKSRRVASPRAPSPQ